MSNQRFFKKYLPAIISTFSFVIFCVSILKYNQYNSNENEKDWKSRVQETLISKRTQIEKALYSRLYYTKGIAANVSIDPNINTAKFDELAHCLINNDSVICTMSLEKDCIISAVYPYKGHESAIGLNLLANPERKKIVENVIVTKKTYVAGPLDLVEGGIGFISYTPIFINNKSDSSIFWGLTDIVIYRDKLFNEINLYPQDEHYKFALKGKDGSGATGECFWGDSTIFSSNPISIEISLPTGSWQFYCVPINGWGTDTDKTTTLFVLLYISAALISILIWLLSKAMLKIRNNERELTALFGAMRDLVIEYDANGVHRQVVETNENLLSKHKDEVIGKSIFELFDQPTAEIILSGIRKCLNTKELAIVNYSLVINNRTRFFEARISNLSNNSVIFVAYDITKRKENEERIKSNNKELKGLNATKDKFFSIIAHDLRNPLGNFKLISNLLADSYDDLDENEKKEFLVMMKDSSNNIYDLLNNLLEWSRSQRGDLKLYPIDVEINDIAANCIQLLSPLANAKEISLINRIPDHTNITADLNLLTVVVRNLISNAIKFTPVGGEISVVAERQGKELLVSVIDNGIGMTQETIAKLFRIDVNITTIGTSQEKGTGLGLILCKEFVEKHGGRIWAESEPDKGSKFIFSLPMSK